MNKKYIFLPCLLVLFFDCSNSINPFGMEKMIFDFEETTSEGGDLNGLPIPQFFEVDAIGMSNESDYQLSCNDDSLWIEAKSPGRWHKGFKIELFEGIVIDQIRLQFSAIPDSLLNESYEYKWYKLDSDGKIVLLKEENSTMGHLVLEFEPNEFPNRTNPFFLTLAVRKPNSDSANNTRNYETYIFLNN